MDISRDSLLSEERPGILRFGGARMAVLDIESGFWGLRRHLEALAGRGLADAVLQQAGANGGASFARAFAGGRAADGDRALRDCIAAYQSAGFGRFEVEALDWPIGRALIRGHDTFEAWMIRRHGRKSNAPACAYSAGVLVGFVNALGGRQDVVCVQHACQAQGAESCLFELLPADQAAGARVVAFDPDPFLSHQLNLLDILFERAPMGIAILDPDLRIRRFNPTWVELVARSAPPGGAMTPGVGLFDVVPGAEAVVLPLLERALQGEMARQDGLPLEGDGALSYWDAVVTPMVENGDVMGVMLVVADATERVRVRQELESRVEARTRELSTLLDVSHKVASTLQEITSYLDPDTVLQLIADEARRLTSATRGLVFLLEGDHLRVSVVSGESVPDILGFRMPVENTMTGQVFKSGRPAIIDDAQRDPRVHGQLARRAGVESLLIVPLMSGSRPVGAISLADKTSGPFGPDDERILTALASGAVVALENARLYHAEQERRQVAETLRGALSILNSNRPLAEILDYIVAEAVRLLGAASGAVYRLQADRGLLAIQAACGSPDNPPADSSLPAGEGPVGRAVLDRRPMALSDLPQTQSPELPGGPYRALLAVPVVFKDEDYGALALYFPEPRGFSDEEVGLAVTFGDQAALAIENDWLRRQARQAGVVEERQRLARELHDSVTQALYSLTMFAAAGSELAVSGDWEKVRHQLGRIGETAQQALKEMRLMVHQLRPPALEHEGLAGALRQRLEAVEGRSGVEARLIMDELLDLPAEVEDGLYRIAQEALNNSLKHAAAGSVTVYLRGGAGYLELEVVDDGRGFSPGTTADRGGMGLNTMRERARLMGGVLTVLSAPGEGTRVKVSLADPTFSPRKKE